LRFARNFHFSELSGIRSDTQFYNSAWIFWPISNQFFHFFDIISCNLFRKSQDFSDITWNANLVDSQIWIRANNRPGGKVDPFSLKILAKATLTPFFNRLGTSVQNVTPLNDFYMATGVSVYKRKPKNDPYLL